MKGTRRMADPIYDMPFEKIGGIEISPNTDIPFGKQFRMGLAEYTIYDRAVEEGYHAGIQAHLEFIHDHNNCPPTMFDEVGFSMVLKSFTPAGMTEHNESIWKAHFIAGWVSVSLGLVAF
jgi:hypothetical protein